MGIDIIHCVFTCISIAGTDFGAQQIFGPKINSPTTQQKTVLGLCHLAASEISSLILILETYYNIITPQIGGYMTHSL